MSRRRRTYPARHFFQIARTRGECAEWMSGRQHRGSCDQFWSHQSKLFWGKGAGLECFFWGKTVLMAGDSWVPIVESLEPMFGEAIIFVSALEITAESHWHRSQTPTAPVRIPRVHPVEPAGKLNHAVGVWQAGRINAHGLQRAVKFHGRAA